MPSFSWLHLWFLSKFLNVCESLFFSIAKWWEKNLNHFLDCLHDGSVEGSWLSSRHMTKIMDNIHLGNVVCWSCFNPLNILYDCNFLRLIGRAVCPSPCIFFPFLIPKQSDFVPILLFVYQGNMFPPQIQV
jgi:hypothetical protein